MPTHSLCGYDASLHACPACRVRYGNVVAARMCTAKPGLGDMVKAGLSAIGITEERVSKAIGRPCGCSKRAESLNALGRKIGIG